MPFTVGHGGSALAVRCASTTRCASSQVLRQKGESACSMHCECYQQKVVAKLETTDRLRPQLHEMWLPSVLERSRDGGSLVQLRYRMHHVAASDADKVASAKVLLNLSLKTNLNAQPNPRMEQGEKIPAMRVRCRGDELRGVRG